MKHTIILSLTLALFWLLNSGHNSVFMLSIGAASVVVVLLISHRMNVVDHESQPIHLTFKVPVYILWLFKELVLANISVVRHIWLGNKTISPILTTVIAKQKTDLGKVIYANSITLTPGTVSVDIVGDRIMVHALRRESIKTLEAGEMDRRVCLLEK